MVNIHNGDSYITHGTNSPITITHQAQPDRDLVFADTIQAIEALRPQVVGGDRAAIDEFLQLANTSGTYDRRRVRETLARVNQVAMAVGTIGVPVLDAIQKLLSILGS